MSLLKKLLLIITCCFSAQPLQPMQHLNKVFKKNQKLFNNFGKKKVPIFKHNPTFGTMRLNTSKQFNKYLIYATLGGIVGYTSWQYAFAQQPEKNDMDKTSNFINADENSSALTDKYLHAEAEQKTTLLYTILARLHKGESFDDLADIYQHSDERQKTLLSRVIAACVRRGQVINNVNNIYQNSNTSQKNILLQGITMGLKKGHEIHRLESVFINSNAQQQTMLFEAIIEYVKHGHSLDCMGYIARYILRDMGHTKYSLLDSALLTLAKQRKSYFNGVSLVFDDLDNALKNQIEQSIPQNSHFEKIRKLTPSQTIGHMHKNFVYIYDSWHTYLENPAVANLCEKIVRSEVEYVNEDYYIMYHTQQQKISFLQLIYNKLWEIKYQQKLENYTFTRFMNDTTCIENARLIENAKTTRKDFMYAGRRTNKKDRAYLLFANYGLWSNSLQWGSSSMHYFFTDSNVFPCEITSADIFKKFGLETFYAEHKDSIDDLEKKFLSSAQGGTILQIALPKKFIEKHLYLSAPYGPKTKAVLKKEGTLAYIRSNLPDFIIGETFDYLFDTTTDNVVDLIELLKNNPGKIDNSDHKEFVLVVTDDTVQKGIEMGVKIKTFNLVDQPTVIEELETLLIPLKSHWEPSLITPYECYKKYKKNGTF